MTEKIIDSQAKLRALLQEQRQLLARFLLITREQEQTIAAEDAEALMQNLEQRQQIISRVEELLDEFTPLWQTHTASYDPEPVLHDLQVEIGSILREANEIEQKNQLAVSARMDYLREQIRRLSETRLGAKAYIQGAELFSAEYVDERQ